jgi:hypothetical protein
MKSKFKVSKFIPGIGFLVERYFGKICPENKSGTFNCFVSFNGAGLPITEEDYEIESKNYADMVCKALNLMEKDVSTKKSSIRKNKETL